MTHRSHQKPFRRRLAMASLEAVLATGLCLPIVAGLFLLGIRACRGFYFLVANLVGWPYM